MRDRLAATPRWILGAAFIAAILGVSFLAMLGVIRRAFEPGGETVRAVFAGTRGLEPGSPVRVHGVDAGKVDSVELDEGARTATVRMTVRDEALPVHADARATIRYRTILGGNLAVDLDPGHTGRLGDAPIPVERTTFQVELEDVTSALTDNARDGLRSVLAETPAALADPSRPRAALGTTADVSPDVGEAADALRGQRDGDLRALVRNAGRVMRAVDAPTEPVRRVVADAAITLGATARRQEEIRRTLRSAPSTLRLARETAQRLDGTLARANPVLSRLQAPARDVAPTVRRVRPLVTGANRLLADAVPLLRSLRPASRDLAAAARDGVPVVRGLDASIRRLADEVLPGLAEVDELTGRTHYQMVGPTFAGLTGAAGQFDAAGHLFRFPAFGGPNTVNTAPCSFLFVNPEDPRFIDCSSLFDALGELSGEPESRKRRRKDDR